MIVTVCKDLQSGEPFLDTTFRIKAKLGVDVRDNRPVWKVHIHQLSLAGCINHIGMLRVDKHGYTYLRYFSLVPVYPRDRRFLTRLLIEGGIK